MSRSPAPSFKDLHAHDKSTAQANYIEIAIDMSAARAQSCCTHSLRCFIPVVARFRRSPRPSTLRSLAPLPLIILAAACLSARFHRQSRVSNAIGMALEWVMLEKRNAKLPFCNAIGMAFQRVLLENTMPNYPFGTRCEDANRDSTSIPTSLACK